MTMMFKGKDMFCSNCGNELNEGVQFCCKCGKRIGAKNTSSIPVASLNENKAKSEGKFKKVLIIAAIIIFGILVMGFLEDEDTSEQENLQQDMYEEVYNENINPYDPAYITEEYYLCDSEDLSFDNDEYSETQIVTEDFWNSYEYYYRTVSKYIKVVNNSYDWWSYEPGTNIDSGLIELYIYPDGSDTWYRIHIGWNLMDGTTWDDPIILYDSVPAAVYKIWNDSSQLPFSLPDNEMNSFMNGLNSIFYSRVDEINAKAE